MDFEPAKSGHSAELLFQLTPKVITHGSPIWEFKTSGGPNMDPYKKDPKFLETAI